MFLIFGVMCLGMAVGWGTRRSLFLRQAARRVVGIAILLLMLILGTEVGGNEQVLDRFGTVGLTAVLLGTGTVAGVLAAAAIVWRYSFRAVAPRASSGSGATDGRADGSDGKWFSLVIVGLFAAGVLLGCRTPAARWTGAWPLSMWALYLLMLAVGMSVGSDAETLRNIVRQPKRSLLVPLASVAGSWVGVSAAWGLLRLTGIGTIGWTDAMAVGSGQGYYSLSGVLLAELRGPEVGTVGLLANILRELLTVVGAAWMARRFSPLGPICAGGATAMDVSLPGILRSCGPHYLALALLEGAITDLSVPLLVPFFAGMG